MARLESAFFNEVDPGLINWADYLLKEWGKWARAHETPMGYSQLLGIRRSASFSLTDDEALRIDAAVASLGSRESTILRSIYLHNDRIRNREGWRDALRGFAERYGRDSSFGEEAGQR